MVLAQVRHGVVVVILLGLAGCAGTSHADAVTAVAAEFHRALAQGNGAAACERLAPETRNDLEQSAGRPCAQAVMEEPVAPPGPGSRVEVFGTQAVVGQGEGATFLARFPDGWRVMAAACQPRPGQPYDCSISGG